MNDPFFTGAWAFLVIASSALSINGAGQASAGLIPQPVTPAALEKMVGQPADIASSAYQYRADRAADQNAPESWILLMQHAGQAIDRPVRADVTAPRVKQVLRALLWEEKASYSRSAVADGTRWMRKRV